MDHKLSYNKTWERHHFIRFIKERLLLYNISMQVSRKTGLSNYIAILSDPFNKIPL